MLFLSRKIGESIIIDDNISLTIQEIKGNSVKIGFEYPKTTRILRKEIFEKIQQENKAAAAATDHITLFLQGTSALSDAPPEEIKSNKAPFSLEASSATDEQQK